MKKPTLFLAGILGIVAVVLVTARYAKPDPAVAPTASQPQIIWSSKAHEFTIFNGTVQSVVFTFTASEPVSAASLFVTPEISGFVSFDRDLPGLLTPGRTYSLSTRISVPKSTSLGTYNGTVHIRSAQRTIPSTLNVVIRVITPSNTFIPTDLSDPSPDRIVLYKGQLEVIYDELLVILKPDTVDPEGRIKQIASSTGSVITGSDSDLLFYELRFPVASVEALESIRTIIENIPDVESATLQFSGGPFTIPPPNDPSYLNDSWDEGNLDGKNWALNYIKALSAWNLTTGSPSVPVAIIDGDFQADHEDLATNVVSSTGNPTIVYKGHGTAVAGIVGAVGNNATGVAGVAWQCALKFYDWPNNHVTAFPKSMAKAMLQAARDGARIVNISDGFPNPTYNVKPSDNQIFDILKDAIPTLSKPIRTAQRQGYDVLWVFAAGNAENLENKGNDAIFVCPANLTASFPENTIAVAAVARDGNLPIWSNWGHFVTVAAPGQVFTTKKICPSDNPSCVPQKQYGYAEGTSASAPIVSGIAALVKSAHPDYSASQIKQAIVWGADRNVRDADGHVLGFKGVNAAKAILWTTNTAPWPMIGRDAQHTSQSPFVGPQTLSAPSVITLPNSLVEGAPVIDKNEIIYFSVWQTNTTSSLYAMNPNGSVVPGWPATCSGSAWGSPAISTAGAIYVACNNNVYAFNPDGSSKWAVPFVADGTILTAPVVSGDGILYLTSFPGGGVMAPGYLYAINPEGTLRWKVEAEPVVSPAIGSDGAIFIPGGPIIMTSGGFTAINADGTIKWANSYGSNITKPAFFTTPTVGQGGLVYTVRYFSAWGGAPATDTLLAIDPSNGAIAYQRDVPRIVQPYAGNALRRPMLAIAPDGTVVYTSISETESRIFALSPDLSSIRFDYLAPNAGVASASPAVIGADGTVYFKAQTNDGNTLVIALSSDGALKSDYSVPVGDLTSGVISSDGTLYFGSNRNKIYAFAGPSAPAAATNLPGLQSKKHP